MHNTRVLIVEDEVIIADHLAESIEGLGYEVIEPTDSYEEAISAIESEGPDICILDIQLNGSKTGIDLAKYINDHVKVPVIFLTSNTDNRTLQEAKQVEPAAFLSKPFNLKDIHNAIELALFNYARNTNQHVSKDDIVIKDAIFVKRGKAYKRLNYSDITYIVSDHVYLELYSKEDRFLVRGSLTDYMEFLPSNFFRSHRSYIINLDFLDDFGPSHVTVGGQQLPLGKKQRDVLLTLLQRG